MNRLIATLVAASLLLVPSATTAHTGSIEDTQRCETGTRVWAHLDANVDAAATWTVTLDGSVVDSGSGPGPTDLGPYSAGRDAGSGELVVTFGQEVNTYVTDWPAVPRCPSTARYEPDAWLRGPYLDPMYIAVFDNRDSNRRVTFKWRYRDGGVWKVLERSVGGHRIFRTTLKHVDGLTTMTIRARGDVLVRQKAAPGGNYPAP